LIYPIYPLLYNIYTLFFLYTFFYTPKLLYISTMSPKIFYAAAGALFAAVAVNAQAAPNWAYVSWPLLDEEPC
jgi:hypothetical protein